MEDAAEKLRLFRGRYIGIAQATLKRHHGVIKQTGKDKTHHSLWLRKAHLASCTTLFVDLP
jgi:hypothetical protein